MQRMSKAQMDTGSATPSDRPLFDAESAVPDDKDAPKPLAPAAQHPSTRYVYCPAANAYHPETVIVVPPEPAISAAAAECLFCCEFFYIFILLVL